MRMPVSFTSLNLVEPEDQIMVSIGLGNMQLLPGELYSDIYLDGFLPQKGTPLLPIALSLFVLVAQGLKCIAADLYSDCHFYI
jgi:hypothetical protein